MNKNILMICAFLMTAIILSTPVMAINPNKIDVTLVAGTYTHIPTDWELRGDVQHGRNGFMIWEDCVLTGDGIYLEGGTLTKTYNYDINVKGVEPTPGVKFRMGKGVLHYEVEIEFEDGTFEGNHMISGEFRVRNSDGFVRPWNSDGYAVYHGTGAYLGWTWVFRDVTIDGSGLWISYLLIPESKLP